MGRHSAYRQVSAILNLATLSRRWDSGMQRRRLSVLVEAPLAAEANQAPGRTRSESATV